MSEVTNFLSLIRKYSIKKEKRQESNWPLSRLYSCISGVFCNMWDTDRWCTWCTINQVPVTLSISILYLCTREMSSFHFQVIIYLFFNSHFEFLPSMSQFLPVFRKTTHMQLFINQCILSFGERIAYVIFYYTTIWVATRRLQRIYLHFWRVDALMRGAYHGWRYFPQNYMQRIKNSEDYFLHVYIIYKQVQTYRQPDISSDKALHRQKCFFILLKEKHGCPT